MWTYQELERTATRFFPNVFNNSQLCDLWEIIQRYPADVAAEPSRRQGQEDAKGELVKLYNACSTAAELDTRAAHRHAVNICLAVGGDLSRVPDLAEYMMERESIFCLDPDRVGDAFRLLESISYQATTMLQAAWDWPGLG